MCKDISGSLSTKFVILHINTTHCLLLLIFHTWLCKMFYLISSLHSGFYQLCLVHTKRGWRRKAIAKRVCNPCRRVLCSCRGRRVSLISYFIVCWILWSRAVRSFPRRNFSICLSGCCYFLFPNWLKVFVCSLSLNCLRLMPLKRFIASLLRISGPRSSVCLVTCSFQVRSSMDTRPLLSSLPSASNSCCN